MSKSEQAFEQVITGGGIPTTEGAAFFALLKSQGTEKTAGLAKAKGIKRVGELLTGSRVRALKDAVKERGAVAGRHTSMANKLERAGARGNDSAWAASKASRKRAADVTSAADRMRRAATRESTKSLATRGAAAAGLGAAVEASDILDKKASKQVVELKGRSDKPSKMKRLGELLTGSHAKKVMSDSAELGRSARDFAVAAAATHGLKRRGFLDPYTAEDVTTRALNKSKVMRQASSQLKDYGANEQKKVTATRLGAGGAAVGAGLLAKKLLTKRASLETARANLAKEVGEANASMKAFQAAQADKELQLKEKGRERAVTNLAAEAYRDKGRRGERVGGTLGSLGGMAAGALLGKRLKSRAAGAALGYLAGGKAGKTVGEELDLRKNASVAEAALLMKAAFDASVGGGPAATPGMDGVEGAQSPGAVTEEGSPQASPDAPPIDEEVPAAPPPGSRGLEATNYLDAELAARDEQQVNEAAFYRQRMHDAMQQLQGVQDELQATQGQLQSLQDASSAVNDQISQKTQQAVDANILATQEVQRAADMRIGLEKMRQQLLQVASQDPSLLAAPPPPVEGAPPPGAPPEASPAQAPPTDAGPPSSNGGGEGQPPPEEPKGESGGAEGEKPQEGSKPPGKNPQLSVKVGNALRGALPWAAGGAALGGGGALLAAKHGDKLRAAVEEMQAGREAGDFDKAKELAKRYAQLSEAERAEKSPLKAMGMGALAGAAALGSVGPQLVPATKRLMGNIQNLRG